ncbi:MAG: glycosyl transferase family 4 [Nanoarchaeota archaeon]|nr:glycosyl transferase family 4 [Nanoarchaeota archaeon]
MDPLLTIALLVSFFLTLFFLPLWIRGAKRAGLVGRDLHKTDKREIAEAGGTTVLFGFVFGVLVYIAIKTFYFKSSDNVIELFAIIASVLIMGFIGLMDDVLGWKIGLTRKTRIFFLIFAAIPLVVINAGESVMMNIDFGILYPLILIPIGMIGTSAFNFIGGYNGLESSQGILILTGLAIVTWATGNSWLSVVALCMVATLIAFYFFNKTPARVFPGDTLTYPIGALIAVMAIMGNIEKIAVFFFIPYILETILVVRGRLKKESYSKVNSDGSLDCAYDKIYGLEHVAVKVLQKINKDKKAYEKQVVYLINAFQIIIILIGFVLFLL